MSHTIRNYINGQWSDDRTHKTLNIINPATADLIGKVPLAPVEDVDIAVQAAHRAF
jgi:acyl-CoA reductase-like NAD-dependent aldehyde dehydrogenase